jgi:hypothetical protein
MGERTLRTMSQRLAWGGTQLRAISLHQLLWQPVRLLSVEYQQVLSTHGVQCAVMGGAVLMCNL